MDFHRKLLIYGDFCLQPSGFQRKTTGRFAIKRFTGSIVLIHKPKKLGNSWIVTSIFTMPTISSHVEVVVTHLDQFLGTFWDLVFLMDIGEFLMGKPMIWVTPLLRNSHMGTFQFDEKIRKCRDLLCVLVALAGYSFSLIALDINPSPKFPTRQCGS